MSAQENIPQPEDLENDIEDSGPSIDDFFRQLEEKERDLQITADLSIEIAELDIDLDQPAQSFVENEIALERGGEVSSANSANVPKARSSAPQPASTAPEQPKGRDPKLEGELAELRRKVAELKLERSELAEKKDQQLKDFENFKYRVDRERRGSFIDQIANLATQMLPVLDNLNRAIDAVPAHAEEHDPAFTHFFQGIVLVSQQVNEVFAGMGVEPIKAIGEPFDPHLHEAVAVVEDPQKKTGTVVEEMLRGYKIGNKVIRHSMVKVVTAGQPAKPANEPPPSEPSEGGDLGGEMIERF
ncbi:MAG: molecular chaperone GrpE [Acidobacteria bacterium OLB17]|nr:MAG: molecular chaperone GrpE [Acidobacteria bacterium OLB17]MCZ2391197.1 nucleotide exchange factor GrpE [Acidobacteriota bacterium]